MRTVPGRGGCLHRSEFWRAPGCDIVLRAQVGSGAGATEPHRRTGYSVARSKRLAQTGFAISTAAANVAARKSGANAFATGARSLDPASGGVQNAPGSTPPGDRFQRPLRSERADHS